MPKQRKVVSLTQALTGQDLQAIIEDLCAVVREWYSDSRHAPRAISAACISAIEQLCRHLVALQLSRDGNTMPLTLTIDVVSLARAAGLPLVVLVSFAYNFQSIAAIVAALRGHGISDPFRGKEWLKRDYGILVEFRHDRIHTSTYEGLDGPAAYETTECLAFILPQDFPDTVIDMRLLQGDVFRGMRLWKMSRRGYEKALELCVAQVARNPDSAKAHAKMGLALAGRGRYEEALAAYAKAIEIEPERAVTHLGRAQTLASMGRAEEALASYNLAVELAPSLAEVHLRRADLLAGMGRAEEALASCGRALGIDGAMHRAHLLKGGLLARMGAPKRRWPRTTSLLNWPGATRMCICSGATCSRRWAAARRRLRRTTGQSGWTTGTPRRMSARQCYLRRSAAPTMPCTFTTGPLISTHTLHMRLPARAMSWRSWAAPPSPTSATRRRTA